MCTSRTTHCRRCLPCDWPGNRAAYNASVPPQRVVYEAPAGCPCTPALLCANDAKEAARRVREGAARPRVLPRDCSYPGTRYPSAEYAAFIGVPGLQGGGEGCFVRRAWLEQVVRSKLATRVCGCPENDATLVYQAAACCSAWAC